MTPYELLDLALSLSNRIDTHWSLFITVHLALMGGIIYVDRPLQKNEKIVAVVIYSGFAAANFFMMKGQVIFLASIYHQIFDMRELACCAKNQVINHIVKLYEIKSTDKAMMSINMAHLIMYILVSISLIYDKALPKSNLSKET